MNMQKHYMIRNLKNELVYLQDRYNETKDELNKRILKGLIDRTKAEIYQLESEK